VISRSSPRWRCCFHLTGSGLGVSGVVVAEIVPVLLLAPLAGPLVALLWGIKRIFHI
jgi:hypothetical protein